MPRRGPARAGLGGHADRRRDRKTGHTAPITAVRVVSSPNEEVIAVYVRVVRFTDTSAEQIDSVISRIRDSGGPPPGVTSSRLQLAFDADQGTAVVLQHFDTAEDMEASARVLAAMDASETPGTRASVDACEVKLDVTPQ
jgi:hypothetical protein